MSLICFDLVPVVDLVVPKKALSSSNVIKGSKDLSNRKLIDPRA